ncbi:RBR-type E3 ubiquitin transferase, partial [Acrasis kona]
SDSDSESEIAYIEYDNSASQDEQGIQVGVEGILDLEKIEKREPYYKILDTKDIISKQQNEIEGLVELLGISSSKAKVILIKFEWKPEMIRNLFIDHGLDAVLKKVNITPNDPSDTTPIQEEVECPLCMNDVKSEESSALPCSHRFCNDCWAQHAQLKVKDGQSKNIRCMYHGCQELVDETIVLNVIKDSSLKALYEKCMAESFVEDNPFIKWCTSVPFCGKCVQSNLPVNSPIEVTCKCSNEFCFKCLKQPHLPSTCDMNAKWEKKCKDDSETCRWITVNTKECPKCHKSIEKNGGCNHMTCKCGTHWCWICGGEMDMRISHRCGRHAQDNSNERAALQRYTHYYSRYQAHFDSRKKEKDQREKISEMMMDLLQTKCSAATLVSNIQRATDTLFKSRKTLQYGYVFSFYVFDVTTDKSALSGVVTSDRKEVRKASQNIWDDNIEELEKATGNISFVIVFTFVEALSKYLEYDIEVIATDDCIKLIVDAAVLVDKRLQILYSILNEDFMQKGHEVPNPIPDFANNHSLSNVSLRDLKRTHEESEKLNDFSEYELEEDDFELQQALLMSISNQ